MEKIIDRFKDFLQTEDITSEDDIYDAILDFIDSEVPIYYDEIKAELIQIINDLGIPEFNNLLNDVSKTGKVTAESIIFTYYENIIYQNIDEIISEFVEEDR